MKKYNPIVLMIYGSVFGVMFGRTQYFFQNSNLGNPFSGILEHGTFPGLWIGAGVGLVLFLLWNWELSSNFEKYCDDIKICERVMKKGRIGGIKVTGMLLHLGGSVLVWLIGGYAVLLPVIVVGIIAGKIDANGSITNDVSTVGMFKWCWLTSAAISLLFAVLRLRKDYNFACAQAAIVVARERGSSFGC